MRCSRATRAPSRSTVRTLARSNSSRVCLISAALQWPLLVPAANPSAPRPTAPLPLAGRAPLLHRLPALLQFRARWFQPGLGRRGPPRFQREPHERHRLPIHRPTCLGEWSPLPCESLVPSSLSSNPCSQRVNDLAGGLGERQVGVLMQKAALIGGQVVEAVDRQAPLSETVQDVSLGEAPAHQRWLPIAQLTTTLTTTGADIGGKRRTEEARFSLFSDTKWPIRGRWRTGGAGL